MFLCCVLKKRDFFDFSGKWWIFLDFLVKITSGACIFESGLKLIFHGKAHSFSFLDLILNLEESCIYLSPRCLLV